MTKEGVLKVIRALSISGIIAGAFTLIACVPYTMLSNWIIVGAAGIVSVTGAVLYVGGLLTVAHLIEK